MKKFKKKIRQSVFFSVFVTIFIMHVIVIYQWTKDQIIFYTNQEQEFLLEQILSTKIYNSLKKKMYMIVNQSLGDRKTHHLWVLYKNCAIKAVVVESVAPDGYSGSIHLLVASYLNGKIIGVRTLSHQETPGIGDKIELSVSDWIKQFSNVCVLDKNDKHVLLKKFGGDIEQFTGATITPQAVTNAVKRTVLFIKHIKNLNL